MHEMSQKGSLIDLLNIPYLIITLPIFNMN